MRMVWFAVLVVAVCLPMGLVGLLVAEAYWPKLDGLTMAMPSGVRSTVAAMAMNQVGFGKDSEPKVERVLKLDSANPEALSRRCEVESNTKASQALATCEAAIAHGASASNYNALGHAQDQTGDFCSAEESYTVANNFVQGGNAFYLRAMGISAYRCGRVAYSVAELGAAESLDEKDAADANADEDEIADAKMDLQIDREWLVVAYGADKMPKEAAESCSNAHPEWKTCNCIFIAGKAVCTGIGAPPPKPDAAAK